jgi:hypothetical protein
MQVGTQFLDQMLTKTFFPFTYLLTHGKAPDRLLSLIPSQERSVQQVIYGPMNSMKRGSTKPSTSSPNLISLQRFEKCREEFSSHGMDDHVTIQHRNVCKDGFAIIDQADAGT